MTNTSALSKTLAYLCRLRRWRHQESGDDVALPKIRADLSTSSTSRQANEVTQKFWFIERREGFWCLLLVSLGYFFWFACWICWLVGLWQGVSVFILGNKLGYSYSRWFLFPSVHVFSSHCIFSLNLFLPYWTFFCLGLHVFVWNVFCFPSKSRPFWHQLHLFIFQRHFQRLSPTTLPIPMPLSGRSSGRPFGGRWCFFSFVPQWCT